MNIALTLLAIALSPKADDGYQSVLRKLAGQCPGNILFEANYTVDLQESNGRWNGYISNKDKSNSSMTIYVERSGSNSENVGVNRTGSKYGPAGSLSQNCLSEAFIRWTGTTKPTRFTFRIKRSDGNQLFDNVKPAYEIGLSRVSSRPGDQTTIFISEKGKVLQVQSGA